MPPLPPSIVPKRAPTPGPTLTLEAFSLPPVSEPPTDVGKSISHSTISEEPVVVEAPVEEAEVTSVVQAPTTEFAAPVPVAEADTIEESTSIEVQSTPLVVEEASPTLPTATVEAVSTPSEEPELPVINEQVVPATIEVSQQVPIAVEVKESVAPVEEPIMVDQPVSVSTPVEEPKALPEPPSVEEQVASEAFTPSSPALAPIVIEPEVPDPFIIDDTDQPLSDEEAEPPHEITPPADVDVNAAAPSDVPVPPEDDTHLAVPTPEEEDGVSPPDSDVPEDEIALTQSVSVAPEQSQRAAVDPTLSATITITTTRSTEAEPPSIVDKPLPTPAQAVVPSPGAASTSDEDEDEDDFEIILPGVNAPTMFLPIPNVRLSTRSSPLTWWLSKGVSRNLTRPRTPRAHIRS